MYKTPSSAKQSPDPAAGSNAQRKLNPSIGLRIDYADETVFGSAVSGRCETELQNRYAVLRAYRQKYGLARLVRDARDVLGRVFPRWLDELFAAPDRLRDDWLYPEPSLVKPVALRIERNLDDIVARLPLCESLAADLASYLGDWQQGATPPAGKAARQLWDALVDAGALVGTTTCSATERHPGIEFVGHATVQIDDGETRLLVDPFLLPRSDRYPDDWQPDSLFELGPPDAILITHSHPDHYDLGSLLRCGADTAIHVPAVRRESVLAIDMLARLRQLGFRNVHAVEYWRDFAVGSLRVRGLPFYGEQPTVGERLHAEVRNEGAVYLVEAAGHKIAVLADAGADLDGDVKQLASVARDKYGPIDTLFGGYRGFALYPVQYVFSSVSRYLPFVLPASRGERQQIMCDADDLIDVAERWQARRIVPYAAGGAPWFWMRGLGPCLDGSMPDAISTDPPPNYVVEVAARRAVTRADGAIASPVPVTVMRAGEFFRF